MMRYSELKQIRIIRKNSLSVGDEIQMDIDVYVIVKEIISSRLTNSMSFDYQIKVINKDVV